MTYSKTLQGRFVATGYPAATMLFVSLLLWVLGYLLCIGTASTMLSVLGLDFIGDTFARLLSMLSFVCTALVLNHLYLFERRVAYLPHLFLWLVSVQLFLQPDCLVAMALLLFMLSVAQLLSCSQECGQEKSIYAAFAILSFSSLFLLQFLYILPLFFVYLLVAKIFVARNFFAALLGVVTPYWLLLGLNFVFPSLSSLLMPLEVGLLNILAPADMCYSMQEWVTLGTELLVWGVAAMAFFVSSFPAKPLLRRRMLFLLVVYIYLYILNFILPQDYSLLLAWRLPCTAVMAAYVFSMRVTRLSNIYFITLNILWLLTASLCLWIV